MGSISSSPATCPAHCSGSPAPQPCSGPKRAPPQHRSPNSTPDWTTSSPPSPAPDTPAPTPPPGPTDRVPPAVSVSPPCCWAPPPPPERSTSSICSTSTAMSATSTWSSPERDALTTKRCRESCPPPSRCAPHQPRWSPSSAATTSTTRPHTGFADIFAVADLTDSDTSRDPRRTAELLQHIGTQIGTNYSIPR